MATDLERYRAQLTGSDPEELLAGQIRMLGLPAPIREHPFAPPRKWRFDFAWPDRMAAVEVEGGSWVVGRHTTGAGFEKDCEKYNEATLLGWRVLRVTTRQIESGQAVSWVETLLDSGKMPV